MASSTMIEIIVTGPNDGVAIIELDPSTSTAEDILVLAEVQLCVPCTTMHVEIESVPGSGKFRRLILEKVLTEQGIEGGASVRLVPWSSPDTDTAHPNVNAAAVPVAPAPASSPSASASAAASPTPSSQQPMSADDLIRHLMSGGSPPPGGVTVSAPTPQQLQQYGRRGGAAEEPPLDPMDPEYQRKLYEQIQRENVEHNLALAMEHTPEAFARVIMLYVPAVVNKHHITAFVDSGAQMTIMNEQTAEKCGLMHLLDRRFGGMAKGVGSAKILGRIHMAMVSLGGIVVPMSISVLEEQSMEFLIGLDQLRRHQMCIDLKKNCLRIGDDAEVPFLGEGELPDHLTNRSKEDEAAEALSRENSRT